MLKAKKNSMYIDVTGVDDKKMEFEERKRKDQSKEENKAVIIGAVGFAIIMIICFLGSKGFF